MAAPQGRAAGPVPAFIGLGDLSLSLSLSVSPSGQPEAVAQGKSRSLWFYFQSRGTWHRTKIAGPGTAFSGPSLAAGPGGTAFVAVEGAVHTLQYYALRKGRWHHTQVAGVHTTYSDPSLALGPHGPGIATEGRTNILWYYSLSGGHWRKSNVFGKFAAYSAPSLVIRGPRQAGPGNPAGQVDIAVQNANHSLSYYYSRVHGGWKSALIVGSVGTILSAPSLLDFRGASAGQSYIVAEGPGHSLTAWASSHGWHEVTSRPDSGIIFSVPSVVQGDPQRPIEIAFRGPSRSVLVVYYSAASNHWVNDVIVQASRTVSSAPALFNRSSHPAGEADLIFQSRVNALWYFHAAKPALPADAPGFKGTRIAGPGSTFGG